MDGDSSFEDILEANDENGVKIFIKSDDRVVIDDYIEPLISKYTDEVLPESIFD